MKTVREEVSGCTEGEPRANDIVFFVHDDRILVGCLEGIDFAENDYLVSFGDVFGMRIKRGEFVAFAIKENVSPGLGAFIDVTCASWGEAKALVDRFLL